MFIKIYKCIALKIIIVLFKNVFIAILIIMTALFVMSVVVFSSSNSSAINTLKHSDPNDLANLYLNITHKITFEIEEKGDSQFNDLTIYSYYIPQTLEPHQFLHNYSSTFSNTENIRFTQGEELLKMEYLYSIPPKTTHKNAISTSFLVTSTPNYPKITQKQQFPYLAQELTSLEHFLEFTDKIDTNSQLREKAFEIVGDEDDVYIIATKVAQWVQSEIEYDLSTINENPNQRATEILNFKKGVCKELSIIYAALMRELQIPTRMVMGYAFTNSDEIIELIQSNWGGHMWTEVYIGDKWVPFDLTYEQFGFVDSSHIAFQYTKDVSNQGIELEMNSYNYDIVKNSLTTSFDISVLSQNTYFSSTSVDVTLSSEYEEYFPESYVTVIAQLQNNEDYYQVVPLTLVFPIQVEELSLTSQKVVLKPNEKKEIKFQVKMPDLKGYIFPFSLYIDSEEIANLSLSLTQWGKYLNKDTLLNEMSSNPVYHTIDSKNPISGSNDFQNSKLNPDMYIKKYSCSAFDFNALLDSFSLQCSFITTHNTQEVTLCSSVACSNASYVSSNVFNVTLPSQYNSRYTIGFNGITTPFRIQLHPPDLKYSLNVTKEEVILNSEMGEDIFYNIHLEVEGQVIEVSSQKSISELQLQSKEYIGLIYYYYDNELVLTEKVSFTIEKKTFFDIVQDTIRNIFT